MGRRVPEDEKKDVLIAARVSPVESGKIQAAAQARKLTVSAWVREAALKVAEVEEVIDKHQAFLRASREEEAANRRKLLASLSPNARVFTEEEFAKLGLFQ